MGKWQRSFYQPGIGLGEDARRVTGCKEHIELSRKAAGEGMVLLKNENQCLPLKKNGKVALFGKGSIDYVKGGGGSGDVTVDYIRNLYEGMKIKEKEGKVSLFHELSGFYEDNVKEQYKEGAEPGMTREPKLPGGLLERAKAFTDTAVIAISRFSGEGWDRKCEIGENLDPLDYAAKHMKLSAQIFENGDFNLTNSEMELVETVKQNFANVIVVMNVGGVVDSSWFKDCSGISSVLMAWQGGMEGGLAMADVLCGDVNPSGKLTDTFAASLDDYPSTQGFHESWDYVDYKEDIYVGYRYFETIPGAGDKVNYPFGFGLSYTQFSIEVLDIRENQGNICILAKAANTGKVPGREVVQVYYSAPQGKLGKPKKVLAAYQKTKLLEPEEEQIFHLLFPVSQMTSYDDLGKICSSAYILEPGYYHFYVGNSVRNVKKMDFSYLVEKMTVVSQLSTKGAPYKLCERMKADGSFEKLPLREREEEEGLERQNKQTLEGVMPAVRGQERRIREERKQEDRGSYYLLDVAEGKISIEKFMEQLSEDDLICLLGGQPNVGVANTYGMGNLPVYGVPNIMTADGPAGLRINPKCGVTTTAWPCATLLACSWDDELVEKVGAAGAKEVKENNIGIWLTPAVNIHRSPLCGRNFEYYSEDPLVAGKIGAAMVRGIQSQRVGASVKHFACNNKETNRKSSDSRVSERALREIYLRAFEIIVKESQPYTLMSSYNLINGVQASENKELLTGILRDEWGYEGIVTTDWWTCGEHYREVKAGNDVKMATGYPERVKEALEKGFISKEEITLCAKRILEMILRVD